MSRLAPTNKPAPSCDSGPVAFLPLPSALCRGRLIPVWLTVDRIVWIIADLPHLAVPQIHLLLLVQVQWPGADTAEDGDLVAALIDRSVAVHALGDVDGMTALGELVGGDQLRRRPR